MWPEQADCQRKRPGENTLILGVAAFDCSTSRPLRALPP